MPEYLAIEIKDDVRLQLALAIWPSLGWLDYEEGLKGHFLMLNADKDKPGVHALVDPAHFTALDHIENVATIMIKKIVTKDEEE